MGSHVSRDAPLRLERCFYKINVTFLGSKEGGEGMFVFFRTNP
jgi:hypothetical protein